MASKIFRPSIAAFYDLFDRVLGIKCASELRCGCFFCHGGALAFSGMRDATALWANAHIVIGARKFTAGAPEVAHAIASKAKLGLGL